MKTPIPASLSAARRVLVCKRACMRRSAAAIGMACPCPKQSVRWRNISMKQGMKRRMLANGILPPTGCQTSVSTAKKQRSRKSARAAIKTGGARRTCWNLRPTVMMDMCLMQRAIRLILRVTVRTASMTSRWSISIKKPRTIRFSSSSPSWSRIIRTTATAMRGRRKR